MSIFSAIKDAIFSLAPAAAAAAAPADNAAPAAAPAPAAPAAAPAQVDVEAILTQLAASSGRTYNWQTSIVDLMTLLNLDASLSAREQLAKELGYTGELGGSAEMNIWLHKKVMEELAANGGKVPANLLHS